METLGVEGVGVAIWVCLVGFPANRDVIEPTIPSTGNFVGGLVGSVWGEDIEESGHKEF